MKDIFAEVVTWLSKIEESHSMGKAVPKAYSINLQRELIGNQPPKPLIELPFADAIADFKLLCERSAAAYEIASIDSPSNLLVGLLLLLFGT